MKKILPIAFVIGTFCVPFVAHAGGGAFLGTAILLLGVGALIYIGLLLLILLDIIGTFRWVKYDAKRHQTWGAKVLSGILVIFGVGYAVLGSGYTYFFPFDWTMLLAGVWGLALGLGLIQKLRKGRPSS